MMFRGRTCLINARCPFRFLCKRSFRMADFARFIDQSSLSLYSAASNLTGNGNLCISPISLVYASMLVYLGAQGQTKVNFDNIYKFNQSTDLTIKPFKDSLNAMQSSASGKGKGDLAHQFANAVFIQNGFEVEPAYLNAVRNQMNAMTEQKDFVSNSEAARDDINSWVQKKTNDKIKELLPSGAVKTLTRAVLVNALYFKAAWDVIFEKWGTKPGEFIMFDGSTKQVDFMESLRKQHRYSHDVDLNAQYLEIPYKDNQASLLIILPKKVNGLREVEAKLKVDTFSRLASVASNVALILTTVPKFKIESSFNAKHLLQKIGLTEMFTAQANLSGMASTEPRLQVSEAFHKTFIEVDEKGTEAHAASGILVSMRSPGWNFDDERIIFKADHPFLFAICHNPSNLILFIGRVENP